MEAALQRHDCIQGNSLLSPRSSFSVATKCKQRGEHMGGFARLTEQMLSAMMRAEWYVAAHSLSKAC